MPSCHDGAWRLVIAGTGALALPFWIQREAAEAVAREAEAWESRPEAVPASSETLELSERWALRPQKRTDQG